MKAFDADKLLDILDVMIVGHKSASDVYDVVDSMPTVDAVEVVRCKDCKWGERTRLKQDGTDDMRYRRDYCTLYSRRHEPSYFCADGERRKDETG